MSAIRLERTGGLVTARFDKARGNAIDEPFTQELLDVARQLGADEGVKAVMLASAHPKLFCPGLDLVTLLEYDRPSMERFMRLFAETVWALYSLRKPVVAAIGGYAVAGGCILTLTADYRILKRGGVQVGLNEVKVGVPLPWSVAVLLRSSLAPSAVTQVALLGRNFADDDALAVGLADQLADADGFEDFCRARLEEFAEKDTAAVAITKSYLRDAALREMRAHETEEMTTWLDRWFSDTTRERIRQIVAGMTKRP
ncbi:MAG TPA: enoyl-CoA hydratase/isomerase family protein [Vicinamibacteria bacterium]|nr:enoyl-CoA hydratase/isomerase family protein [Vicinamibacteria bacterium]